MHEHDQQPSRRPALIALVVVVLLVACGLWLSNTLRQSGKVEDCLMAGRRNCAPISADGTIQPPK